MSGNFFARQRTVRRQSFWLLVLFLITLSVLSAALALAAGLLTWVFGQAHGNTWLAPQTLAVAGLLFLIVLLGCLFRALEMRKGTDALAQHFGASPVRRNRGSRAEPELLSLVEEMAIAARVPMPDVRVMPRERGINAFAARAGDDQYMIVLTQGALDHLDREELQGVVAHEFGHIANGDLPLTMRMLVAFSGLLAVHQVGRLLGGDSVSRDNISPAHVVGGFLVAIGSVGVLASGLIRAAFGRRRELLADDSAVQFTRYPDGLASALDKVRSHPQGSRLSGYYAGELAHLCLLPVASGGLLERWFAVHPPLETRINRISPGFERRRRKDAEAQQPSESLSASMGYAAVTEDVLGGAGIDPGGLPDALLIALPDTAAYQAALCALLMIHFEGKRALFAQAVALNSSRAQAQQALTLAEKFPRELDHYAVELIRAAAAAMVAEQDQAARSEFAAQLKKYARLDGSMNLHEYVLLALIHSELCGAPVAPTSDQDSYQAMGVVVSLLTEAAGYPLQRREDTLRGFMGLYGDGHVPLLSLKDPDCVDKLANALSVLHGQIRPVRDSFVRHVATLVLEDGHISSLEKNLLQLLASTLAVRLPRLL
ncbi:M48 family metalloprotease [Granulosicoccaceae sp. 1_MG-2023]|nr:M48 family metalloprotease [Granulosicoccaceae sp. 1_MG-2023]